MNQSQLIVAILIALLVLGIFLSMLRSWRRRLARQSAIGSPATPPPGTAYATLEGLYLGTTLSGKPLDRIAVAPLGFRARGLVLVRPDGVELQLDGTEPVFLPAADLIGHGRASWAIDRGVEEDGLNRVTWRQHGTELDTFFRMREPDALDSAIEQLLGSQRSVT